MQQATRSCHNVEYQRANSVYSAFCLSLTHIRIWWCMIISHSWCNPPQKNYSSNFFLLLPSSFYPPLFFCRNLGKSGLRVSCLGLGEFCAGKSWNIFLPVSTPSNQTNVSISSSVQAPGWHLDRRSLMRWELRCLALLARAVLATNTFSRIALAEGAQHRKSQCFHYRPVSKKIPQN